jgi:hypothetical protein
VREISHVSRIAFAFVMMMKRVEASKLDIGLDITAKEGRILLAEHVQRWALVLDVDPDAAAAHAMNIITGASSQECISLQDEIRERVVAHLDLASREGKSPLLAERVGALASMVSEDGQMIDYLQEERNVASVKLSEAASTEEGGYVVTEAVSRFSDNYIESGRLEEMALLTDLLIKKLVERGRVGPAIEARAIVEQALAARKHIGQ